jgi:hypothetical protein
MYFWKYTIAVLLLLALLGGCRSANLTYQGGALDVQIDTSRLTLGGTPIYHRKDSFGNLYLTQVMLRLQNGTQIAYERAETDPLYEFNLSPSQTIRALFDGRQIRLLYYKSSMSMAQMLLSDGRVLNIVFEQFDDQRLTFIYGMPTSQMRTLIATFDPQAAKQPMHEHVVTIPVGSHGFLSHWSVQKVQLTPLITPLRYNYGLL